MAADQPVGPEGIFMVIGAPDAGKSTFARYLFKRFQAEGLRAAFLDGDPGQASLGPPTMLTLSLST
jgi:polynucleotide 5'-kinase involved in rRNA processing